MDINGFIGKRVKIVKADDFFAAKVGAEGKASKLGASEKTLMVDLSTGGALYFTPDQLEVVEGGK